MTTINTVQAKTKWESATLVGLERDFIELEETLEHPEGLGSLDCLKEDFDNFVNLDSPFKTTELMNISSRMSYLKRYAEFEDPHMLQRSLPEIKANLN